MDRKDFLKLGCNACLCGAAAMLLPCMQSCSPSAAVFKTAEPLNNTVELPLSLFDKENIQFIRPKGWQYDIAVQKKSEGTYVALLMQCTHMDNQLSSEQNGFSCSLHGSRFNKEGIVVKGPAEMPLKKYEVSVSNNTLIIKV
jgi:Rieske Fe-S protein